MSKILSAFVRYSDWLNPSRASQWYRNFTFTPRMQSDLFDFRCNDRWLVVELFFFFRARERERADLGVTDIWHSMFFLLFFTWFFFSLSFLRFCQSASGQIDGVRRSAVFQPLTWDVAHFPMPLLLPGILCLVKLGMFSELMHSKPPRRVICSNPNSAS